MQGERPIKAQGRHVVEIRREIIVDMVLSEYAV